MALDQIIVTIGGISLTAWVIWYFFLYGRKKNT